MGEEEKHNRVREWCDKRLDAHPKDLAEPVRNAIESFKYKRCVMDPGGAPIDFS